MHPSAKSVKRSLPHICTMALVLVISLSFILTGCTSGNSTSESITGASAQVLASPVSASVASTSDVSGNSTDISANSAVSASSAAAASSSTFTVSGSVSSSASTESSTFYVKGTAAVVSDTDSEEDNSMTQTDESTGTNVSVSTLASETDDSTLGIDVASYQAVIDWKSVASAGIDFAMIRVGYRSNDGVLHEDANARYNLQEATKYGIKTGAYFFSRATSSEEAIQEADLCVSIISGYSITYPVAYNCEGYNKETSRQYGISSDDRTAYATAFLNEVANCGYTPMFYASKNELSNSIDWNTDKLASRYKIWLAYYPSDSSTTDPGYSGSYCMWQYTNKGSIAGINGSVDIDVAYFGYSGTTAAKSNSAATSVTANVESGMTFTDVNEKVTAKETVNLRDRPSQGSDSVVAAKLTNGDTATRTGINETTGWSRITYNGKTLYAVSSYLTTDLSYSASASSSAKAATSSTAAKASASSGTGASIKTKFTACNEQVTAKSAINLRSRPSITAEGSNVVAKVYSGDVLTRTGINEDLGWSRVEYNGQTLYCVSSYLTSVSE